MGFFDRLVDFGDREQVKTIARRIDIGLQQLEEACLLREVAGLSSTLKIEIDNMILLASKLSMESLMSLEVQYKGQKILYFIFLSKISEISDRIVTKGGHPLI